MFLRCGARGLGTDSTRAAVVACRLRRVRESPRRPRLGCCLGFRLSLGLRRRGGLGFRLGFGGLRHPHVLEPRPACCMEDCAKSKGGLGTSRFYNLGIFESRWEARFCAKFSETGHYEKIVLLFFKFTPMLCSFFWRSHNSNDRNCNTGHYFFPKSPNRILIFILLCPEVFVKKISRRNCQTSKQDSVRGTEKIQTTAIVQFKVTSFQKDGQPCLNARTT